jgi:dsDNA-specific endonuclease/ATPase MutS2
MAEERYVSQDQHRADLVELRREFKEETAGLRQDVAVLAKTVEHLAQTMTTGFAELRQEMVQLRQETRQEMTQLRQDMRQDMVQLRQDIHQDITQLRQEIRDVRATGQRQMWVILGAVIVALIKIAFFP